MTKEKSASRRDFLRRSSAATLAAMVGPGALSMIPSREGVKEQGRTVLTVSKSGFPPHQLQHLPKPWEYATLESMCNGAPVWSFSNLCYIYEAGPDLMPELKMQEGNRHSPEKIKLKKSWEIKHNLCGAESEMTCRTAYNDSQPMLPIHLIDGDPETVWSSWGLLVPDGRPEWIRIDLPIETQVTSVILVCAKEFARRYPPYGSALPQELEVRTSRDAYHWDTIYANKNVSDEQTVEIKFEPRSVKQIWIIGQNFPKKSPLYDGHIFSIAGVKVQDPSGNNVALVSRGANVTVSSVSYLELNDRFTEDALWGPLNYDLGNKWLRIGGDNGSFMWHYVEHEKGKLELDPRGDESVTLCVQHGINMIVNLDFKGNWIYENPPRKTDWIQARFREINDSYNDELPAADANPEMYEGYKRYVAYMAQKLKGRVAYLELGNEWNAHFPPEHYVKTFFEPAFAIVKQVWPDARIMLGSQTGFDQNSILDCLGRERRYGIKDNKLLLTAKDVIIIPPEEPAWPVPERAGAIAVLESVTAGNVTVSADGENGGMSGIILRYRDVTSYLAAMYSASDHSIAFYEVVEGKWGKAQGVSQVPNLGKHLHFVTEVRGNLASFTLSNGSRSISTTYELKYVHAPGKVGLMQRAGDISQLFGNVLVKDAQGKILAKEDFNGPDGTIPPGWKYISGGPNPIPRGIATRIDGISWHPTAIVDPDRTYFTAVREFQQKCRDLGFKGHFFANEIYSGSMYPPGPQSSSHYYYTDPEDPLTEGQMAKYLVRSLVGHNGLDVEAGFCHPAFSGRVHPQALCQGTWGVQTVNPCRTTMSYYMWRNVATIMDDFHPSDFPVGFRENEGLLFFTFRRGGNERMVSVWIDGPSKEGITEKRCNLTLPGARAKRAIVADIMNGIEQQLDFTVNGPDTLLEGLLIKDYPVFITFST